MAFENCAKLTLSLLLRHLEHRRRSTRPDSRQLDRVVKGAIREVVDRQPARDVFHDYDETALNNCSTDSSLLDSIEAINTQMPIEKQLQVLIMDQSPLIIENNNKKQ